MSDHVNEESACPPEAVLRQFLLGLPTAHDEAIDIHLERCSACVAALHGFVPRADKLVGSLTNATGPSALFERGLKKNFGGWVVARTLRFAPGQVIGNYRIVSPIGQGAMGEVYRATQLPLNRFVAFKVISSPHVNNDDAARRFEKGAKATGRLDHPNIVHAFDASRIDNICYLAMEFVDGLNVSEIVERVGPLSVADACEIVWQAAKGLAHGHSRGCVHRDIKPSNLMIDKDGRVKVTDFGLATLMRSVWDSDESPSDTTDEGDFLGTPDYMAPEQFRNARDVDGRADIYGLGCTLYKLLTGRAPFESGERRSVLDKARDHQETAPPTLKSAGVDSPARLSELLSDMLAKTIEHRCANGDEVATRLAPLCAGADLSELVARADASLDACFEESDSMAEMPQRPRLRRSSKYVTAVALFVLLALVTVIARRDWLSNVGGVVADANSPAEPIETSANEIASAPPPVFEELVLDDTEAIFEANEGSLGWRRSELRIGYGGNHTFNAEGATTATWTIAPLADGKYTIYATWPQLPPEQCSPAVSYHIYDGDTRAVALFLSHQQAPPDAPARDDAWALLGSVDLTSGRLRVEIDARISHGHGTTGPVRVDAIRIVRDGDFD